MADCGRTRPVFGGTDWILSCADRIEEVPHVIVADLQSDWRIHHRSIEDLRITRIDRRAVHPDPAVRSLKPDAVALTVRLQRHAERAVVDRGSDDLLDAISPGQRGLEFRGRGVAAWNRLRERPRLNLARSGKPDCPPRRVVVMRAPVGDGPSGVIEPPPERLVAVTRSAIASPARPDDSSPVRTRRRRPRAIDVHEVWRVQCLVAARASRLHASANRALQEEMKHLRSATSSPAPHGRPCRRRSSCTT